MQIEFNTEQLRNEIIEGIKPQLDELKNHLQPKVTEYLTRQETADLLKVDLSTIHNWTKQSKLIAYSIGKRVYYKRSEVESAIIKLNK
ncbi:helix-turn-helix domain-containing protein [Tenacibaculum maritimum]|uniref:helix-turn-helix domain-containing protein n=1 Tax=Tenacibaculum maritimum TaxID=107401 RepID=UPI001E530952|nr:helix-turn-helix domain-containing protein [Tenacibaculum maritimum]MCD9621881.1 helix-turn-helix domain-containing protein [Tenacibaculum maritimum]MCD9628251.1 helix-turn-helix domain-containing protein [Tenacibaculum maritimum]MCD9631073.1 helix-turn-helix domain-containing protein [Tenacibaculum maritimum]MCD9634057.1 helix-turn-helix domain-containing protein [Tenacibaculum maritimum]